MSGVKRYSNLREFCGVIEYEWRTRKSWESKRAAIRGAWWWLIRRYPSELCKCGRRVGGEIGSWWHADDELWAEVMGWPGWEKDLGKYAYLGPPGTRCCRCFTRLARAKGIHLHWAPVVHEREALSGHRGAER